MDEARRRLVQGWLIKAQHVLATARKLAEDAKVPAEGTGFRGVTLAHNVRRREEVSEVLALAEAAGGKITKPAQDTFWGGHGGYFSDPDGHLWEVAWNPDWELPD